MTDPGQGNVEANAGPAPLADQKLQLEIEKLEREKKAAELQAAATGQSLADRKLQLEIEKLEQEKNAAGLTATADTCVGQPKTQLELNKLHNDLLKAKAEADAAIAGKTLRIEWFKAYGGFVTAAGALAAAIIAILTLGSAIQKQNVEEQHRFSADAAGLIDSLGDASEAKRAAAAIALRPYTDDSRTQALAVSALAFALGAETSPDVQQAIAASLIEAGRPAKSLLHEVKLRENAIVSTDFYKVGDRCVDILKLKPEQAQALTRLRARQTAVILAALAISRIDARQGVKSVVDLSTANLKCYEFHGLPDEFDSQKDEFDGVDLTNAVMVQATLYRKSLKHANLTGAEATEVEFNYADLTGATVTNAEFNGASMKCVKLLGAIGLTKGQLESANHPEAENHLEGASLDKDLAAAFQDAVKLKEGPCI